MDAADNTGNALVGYAAKLQWKGINLYYNGFTFLNSDVATEVLKRNTFRQQSLPETKDNIVTWSCMQAKGSWQLIDNTITEKLYESEDGELNWTCLFPKASADIQIGEKTLEKSLGYVEKIHITIPPWKLPIAQLHWGRFLSQDHTLIWIRWIGPVPKTIVYLNGQKITDASITETGVTFQNYRLELTGSRTLRKGTLLSTVFSNFPSLLKLFPKSVLSLRENKWLSEGLLKQNGSDVSTGKVIHEFVVWE